MNFHSGDPFYINCRLLFVRILRILTEFALLNLGQNSIGNDTENKSGSDRGDLNGLSNCTVLSECIGDLDGQTADTGDENGSNNKEILWTLNISSRDAMKYAPNPKKLINAPQIPLLPITASGIKKDIQNEEKKKR